MAGRPAEAVQVLTKTAFGTVTDIGHVRRVPHPRPGCLDFVTQ
jgi:hypothetical protein